MGYLEIDVRLQRCRTKPDGLSSNCRTCFNQRVNATRDEKRALKRSRAASSQHARDHAAGGSGALVSPRGPSVASSEDAAKRRCLAPATLPSMHHVPPHYSNHLGEQLAAITGSLGGAGRLQASSEHVTVPRALAATYAAAAHGRQLCPSCLQLLPVSHFTPNGQNNVLGHECVNCESRARLRQQLAGQPLPSPYAAQHRLSSVGDPNIVSRRMLVEGLAHVALQPPMWPDGSAAEQVRPPARASSAYESTIGDVLRAVQPPPPQRCLRCQRLMPPATANPGQSGVHEGLCSLCQLAAQLVHADPQSPLPQAALQAGKELQAPEAACGLPSRINATTAPQQQSTLGPPATANKPWHQEAFLYGCG